ncbi:MAG: zinc ribbon domain-containing protein [Flavobacteriales bacterium]
MAKKKAATTEFSVEEKLQALHQLQIIDSEIDKIRTVRGELPLEVQDLEDDLKGLETRIEKIDADIADKENFIAKRKLSIKEAEELIKKYNKQLESIKNNREYDSLTKEIEFQNLEIELANKKINDSLSKIDFLNETKTSSTEQLNERTEIFDEKKKELDSIVSETEKDEKKLLKQSTDAEKVVDERLLTAYKRIRKNSRNGLAVVSVQRDACGGCFSKIPPQRQLDIKTHKKIIVCEHCGRILIDSKMFEKEEA